MNKIITIIVALAGVLSARADSSVLQATNAYPWVSSVAAGLTLTRGNSDLMLATAKFQTEKKLPVDDIQLGADGAYGKSDGVNNANSLHGDGQYNHLFSDRFYGYVNLDALHDAIQDLAYRVSASPGAGYYFIKETRASLMGEVGPGLITERLGNYDETYATLRLAENGQYKISDGAKVWEKAELLPQVNKFDNYIVNSEIGVESALTKTLSLQVVLDDSYVNQPATGRKANDVKLVSGVVYKF